jgi:hypothetical protein
MADGLNSARRYVINNFVDDINQMAIDAMLVRSSSIVHAANA